MVTSNYYKVSAKAPFDINHIYEHCLTLDFARRIYSLDPVLLAAYDLAGSVNYDGIINLQLHSHEDLIAKHLRQFISTYRRPTEETIQKAMAEIALEQDESLEYNLKDIAPKIKSLEDIAWHDSGGRDCLDFAKLVFLQQTLL